MLLYFKTNMFKMGYLPKTEHPYSKDPTVNKCTKFNLILYAFESPN